MVVICHPDPHSFNHALTNEVQEAWSEAGFNVTLRDLYLEGCNPIITAAEARGARSLDPLVTSTSKSCSAYWPSYTRFRIGFLPDEDRAPIRSRQRSLRRRTTKPAQPAAAWSEAIGSGAAAAAP
jgi:putative NADPH-quinone reductase